MYPEKGIKSALRTIKKIIVQASIIKILRWTKEVQGGKVCRMHLATKQSSS
jgi:hypothetical protein